MPWKLQSPDFHFLLLGVPGKGLLLSSLPKPYFSLHAQRETPLHAPRCTFFPKMPSKGSAPSYFLEGSLVILLLFVIMLLGYELMTGPCHALLHHALFAGFSSFGSLNSLIINHDATHDKVKDPNKYYLTILHHITVLHNS